MSQKPGGWNGFSTPNRANLRKPTLDSINGINEPSALDTKDTPIVTGNRIFVTVSVVGFGMSKAIVTCHGLPTSANTLDWVFVVPSLSVFFIPSSWELMFLKNILPRNVPRRSPLRLAVPLPNGLSATNLLRLMNTKSTSLFFLLK